jgi:hypothetical protein
MPQINQKAIIEGELYKQSIKRDRALKQIEQDELSKTLQANKNPKMQVVDVVKAPIFENEKGFELRGPNPNWREKPQGNGDIFVPAIDMNRTNVLLIVGLLLIVLGFIFSQKK